MEQYNSALLSFLYENDQLISPNSEVLNFKENLLGGSSLVDGNRNTIFETMPSAAGGETVMFADGETAHMTANIYGSTTIDFTGTTNDIVGRTSIFGEESFYQGGEFIGSMKPNFTGEGFDITSSNGEVLTTSHDIFGGTQVAISSSLIDSNPALQAFDLQNSFSEIDTISLQMSVADLGSETDALDGLDFLGLF